MPELPEVEHVAKALNERFSGRRIRSAELHRPRLAPDSTPDAFAMQLEGAVINHVHRRGKNILFDLDSGRTLLAHLRMSGRFFHLTPDRQDPKFAHAVFHLEDGTRLVFDDQRHFGLMKILETKHIAEDRSIACLAPEPFSAEFSPEYLRDRLVRSNRSLKEFLLDQTQVCGLGNIYAVEAMFRSGLSPRRRARNVPRSRVGPLFESIRAVLSEAISLARLRYPDPVAIGEGVYGNGVSADWMVYEREGLACRDCSSPIKRIRQGSRSTYFCSKCQR